MTAVLSHSLLPPADSPVECNRKSELPFQVALLVVAVAAGYLFRCFGPAPVRQVMEAVTLQNMVDVSALFAAVLAAMMLHESGHLFLALAVGFQVIGASLGPLRIQTLHGKWKLSFWRSHCFHASVSAAPRQLSRWRARMFLIVAAGPLATLSAALYGCYLLQHPPPGHPFLLLFLRSSVQVNILLFLLGLIPNSASACVRNDARLLIALSRGGNAAEELELSVLLTHQLLRGARPQDYPEPLLTRLAAWRGRPEGELTFAHALSRWAIDSAEWSTADAWDSRALALSRFCDRRLRNHALASSGCLDVLLRDDLETARNKFAQVEMHNLFPRCFEHRARAAQQIALGRSYKAAPEIIRAQYALPLGIPAYDLERHLLAELHMRALSRPSARPAGAALRAFVGLNRTI